ncbi:BsuBI/PstI family type II restriction endonuclease [Saccharothrix yanglingensis]|uniref:site-specific DNA-methyltransferase (adenine-specific) n=1 Tax=Saccharothrix yanglingensis TaxID=659496 RepID=A0ABU0WWL9_9PSEU|nr:BsuBI/PstI family type II restriction endonuclease [Saccharothrix yanglingensis]MDQ2583893.1 hypothetical protein [Saccharothrix yanglingensis]
MTISVDVPGSSDGLLARVEARRRQASADLSATSRRQLGQFFTPRKVAELIAAQPRLDQVSTISVLDPGAGAGVLTAALVARVIRERPDLKIAVTAVEVDETLVATLHETLDDCRNTASDHGVELTFNLVNDDFINWGTAHAGGSLSAFSGDTRYDVVIQNPPYGKLTRSSSARHSLAMLGVEVPNLYAAFVALASRLLAPNGQLVAITPRSFCNGTYFRDFRKELLRMVGIDTICVFHERGTLFADSAVLQETVIFSATGGHRPEKVKIATGRGYDDAIYERSVPYEEVVHPGDPEKFLRIPTDGDDDTISSFVAKLPVTLQDLQLSASTGRVVDFRATEYLHAQPKTGTVPLIYPQHFKQGCINWPLQDFKKNNAIAHNAATEKLLLPRGYYVLVKRLSSKEEARRVVACVFRAEDSPTSMVGFENHLNVIHSQNHGISPLLAIGLTAWLNSEKLDLYFRQFSGHTQVNATDLRNMRYPDHETLVRLGAMLEGKKWPKQHELDQLVEQVVLGIEQQDVAGDGDVGKVQGDSVAQASQLLKALNFDAERSNERSSLVLLALANLRPGQPWPEATNPILRTVDIMDFLRQHHGKDYKPNTRETIRRRTLHQFAEPAYLIQQNPDNPLRPVNSPKWCYQLTDRAIALIRLFGTEQFEAELEGYLAELPGLQATYAADRAMNLIPLTWPGGMELKLSPGGQNELLREMIENFCPRFTPGGKALYIGDAKKKMLRFEKEAFADLGLAFDKHGKMPDLVVYLPDKNWLVLMEAASNHGPVDAKRHGELQTLFAGSTAGLVFVSCFPSRVEMRKELKNIAWETEVWCADAPTHMIHFNGERFLGPY